MTEQEQINRNWELKTEMVSMHNKMMLLSNDTPETQDEYNNSFLKLLQHIDTNLDSEDEQYLCMAIDCLPLDNISSQDYKELYKSIAKKYKDKQFSSFRIAMRVSMLELLVEDNENNTTK